MPASATPSSTAGNSSLFAVEVFKTSVASAAQGAAVVQALHHRFPTLTASLDLEDCDRVLRVQSLRPGPVFWEPVMELVYAFGISIEILPE